MNLYCESCNKIHRLTAGDVERMVYALEANNREIPDLVRPEADEADCLLGILSLADDSEGYAEHTTACVEKRRLLENGAKV